MKKIGGVWINNQGTRAWIGQELCNHAAQLLVCDAIFFFSLSQPLDKLLQTDNSQTHETQTTNKQTSKKNVFIKVTMPFGNIRRH